MVTPSCRTLGVALLAAAITGCSSGTVAGDEASPATDAVRTVQIDDRSHVDGEVVYRDTPPLGGPHAPIWVNCGRYDQEVPDELAVHALEHGAVWITHPVDIGENDLAVLDDLAASQSHVLVSPLPSATRVVATAWGAQLELDGVKDPALAVFVETYLQGPQTPEPGAPCTGGVGQPVV
ncbi:DUF3105 domain-containing protein [Nitriliruptoraceae bacterium ZYF776]|nr:DUF3105 domain-containing protein [Profundirhabdus halotolerans]